MFVMIEAVISDPADLTTSNAPGGCKLEISRRTFRRYIRTSDSVASRSVPITGTSGHGPAKEVGRRAQKAASIYARGRPSAPSVPALAALEQLNPASFDASALLARLASSGLAPAKLEIGRGKYGINLASSAVLPPQPA